MKQPERPQHEELSDWEQLQKHWGITESLLVRLGLIKTSWRYCDGSERLWQWDMVVKGKLQHQPDTLQMQDWVSHVNKLTHKKQTGSLCTIITTLIHRLIHQKRKKKPPPKKKIPQNLNFFPPQPSLHTINWLYVATTQRNFNGSLRTAWSKVWRFWMVVLKKPEASPFPTPGTRLFTICFNTFTMSLWLVASEFTE